MEIAIHPLLIPHLSQTLLEVLQQALDAHRYALSLNQDDPDSLFNTAQVLTAIAEAYAKGTRHADQDALPLLEEALELQSSCLSIQELKLEESIQQQQLATTQASSESQQIPASDDNKERAEHDDEDSISNVTEDQWFSIVEPVTKDTLIDTILAQLSTLTTLCSILGSAEASAPSSTLAWIEEYSSKLINTKLPILLHDADVERMEEVALARANFVSELLRVGYFFNALDADTYNRERDEAFHVAELDLERNFSALMANASSLIAFNAALAEGNTFNAASHAASRWSALSAAITNMATAAKLSDLPPEDIAETHFGRGDCSLLQHQLGQPPVSHNPAMANSIQLLKNADTFYRNASKLYQDDKQKAMAQFRSRVAQTLQAGADVATTAMQRSAGMPAEWVKGQLEDMIDDGLIFPIA